MKIKKNVGKKDRLIRFIVAAITLYLGFTTANSIYYIIAAIAFFTGLFNFCGLYTLFGINTCKIKK